MLILLIFPVFLVHPAQAGEVVAVTPLQCLDESAVLHSVYHAPARAVPFPRVDAEIKRGFLNLFHRSTNPTHSHNNPHDQVTAETCEPPVIDPAIIAQINALCPIEAFFYSFAPRHVMAQMLLQEQFTNLTTPADVLRVSRSILNRHAVNPRLWYYALASTILMRPDLNGYYLAWASDATPDLYMTNSVLTLATQGSSRPQPASTSRVCTTSIGVQVTDVRYELPGRNSSLTIEQQNEATQNACRNNSDTRNVGVENIAQPASPPLAEPSSSSPAKPSFSPEVSSPHAPKDSRPSNYITYPIYEEIKVEKFNEYDYGKQKNEYDSGHQNNEYGGWDSGGYSRKRSIQEDAPDTDRSSRVKRQTADCILYNGTTGATGEENRLWYFREDMMVNHHHWYWHQAFPLASARHADRRGEQFYFAHHNIIARYNAERLSNGLALETPLDLRIGANIGEGYNSDIVDSASGRFWTPRVADTPLNDIFHMRDRDFQLDITLAQLSGIYNNLTSHIAQGFLLANRSNNVFPIDIRNPEGLSHVGNTLEASEELSTHPQYYNTFGVHNLGHIAIALSTDPDYSCELPTGVMADLTVTMRDPAFYKIHSLVDAVIDQHKRTLTPYQLRDGEWPLKWDGVTIQNLEMISGTSQKVNHVQTFWSLRRFPLEEGIDGSIHDGDVDVDICHQHLNHEPFTLRLTVDVNSCTRTVSNRGTARIFMAPRFDRDGRRFTMEETRKLMFQLDSFPIELRRGRNTITRNSQDSSSTRPWSRSLQDMLRNPDNGGQTEYCGCGWPRHLYMPKGNPHGMSFDLFSMVTSFDQDQVLDTFADLRIQEPCHSPHLVCGVPYRRYPDSRPMGYPFDRQPYLVVDGGQLLRPAKDLEEYMAPISNMKSSIVIVQHLDSILA